MADLAIRPSDSMCASCHYALDDCSRLPFGTMRRIRLDADGTVVVRCTAWTRSGAVYAGSIARCAVHRQVAPADAPAKGCRD